MRAFDAACAVPWAIREEYLRLILSIANREISIGDFKPNELTAHIEAVEQKQMPRLAGSKTAFLVGDVAILPVYGPIVRYASFFSEISGATSVSTIAQDFRSALDNPNVKSILLDVDSPGGELNGTEELASIIYGGRGGKQIHAYIGNEGASAAYWISSATDRIIAAPTSLVGSIGVVAVLPDPSKRESTSVEFVSSQSPKKRADITTKEGRSQVQTVVDDIADIFIASVARNRGVSIDTVLSKYGQGGVFVGQKSVDAGLADEIGSFESALASFEKATAKETKPVVKANKDEDEMGLRAEIERLLAGDIEEKEIKVADTVIETKVIDPPVADPVVPTAVIEPKAIDVTAHNDSKSDRERQLEAEVQKLRTQAYRADATSLIKVAVAEGRAFPTEQEVLIDMYVQACIDDRNFGVEKGDGSSRVSAIEKMIAARPKGQLTSEQLGERFRHIVSTETKTAKPGDELLDNAEMDAFLALTPLGQSELEARRKNGNS